MEQDFIEIKFLNPKNIVYLISTNNTHPKDNQIYREKQSAIFVSFKQLNNPIIINLKRNRKKA